MNKFVTSEDHQQLWDCSMRHRHTTYCTYRKHVNYFYPTYFQSSIGAFMFLHFIDLTLPFYSPLFLSLPLQSSSSVSPAFIYLLALSVQAAKFVPVSCFFQPFLLLNRVYIIDLFLPLTLTEALPSWIRLLNSPSTGIAAHHFQITFSAFAAAPSVRPSNLPEKRQ